MGLILDSSVIIAAERRGETVEQLLAQIIGEPSRAVEPARMGLILDSSVIIAAERRGETVEQLLANHQDDRRPGSGALCHRPD